ncbi:ABC transporter permease [Aquibacillus sp. 3ASR75-11]|uniref:Transport permease protein n=1 Tax=Terrihalobacillus insolitus TaxID=2950438 RepID=A0A9X3WSN5_9BACI|nr:ABC transporter permease [Terrihalobacillus insolitus]MDC3411821.1 ABC transporter permease [Terrihalobacillus insolitus]MDC3425000.1 ABC transporter permease [Terrihalobacillus insolitus]
MLSKVWQVLHEQISHWHLIVRMSIFETRGIYQVHYLGTLWQFINPAIQVGIYWFVFGFGIRGGQPVGDVPFFLWLLMGIIPWFFISPTMIQGSNSIYQKVSMVSKMNFPVSVLPSIKIVSNSFQFIILMVLLFIILLAYGIEPTIYLLQLPYYLLSMYVFLFAFTLLSSTVSTLVRDYQMFLQSMMRMLLYVSPILWDPRSIPIEIFVNIVKLNPFYYIIEGIRSSLLGTGWFFDEPVFLLYFWSLTFTLLFLGAQLHMKFRKNFVDYL